MFGSFGRALLAVILVLIASGALVSPHRVRADAIDTASLLFDGHSTFYRSPFGSVQQEHQVRIRFRTALHGATGVTLAVDAISPSTLPTALIPMQVNSSDSQYDYWQAKFAPMQVGFYGFHFVVQNGSDQIDYQDQALPFGSVGTTTKTPSVSKDYVITSYQKGFTVPTWLKNAVMYQIFPDRFFNGDKSNDHKLIDPAYGNLHPIVHTNVNDPPTDSVDFGQLDFYGGDLKGIIDKLPYLKKLGISVLYLNPIFQAATNHGYDTADYMKIAPHFGTLKTFKSLIAGAHKDGIKVILDGVFNHSGSDSLYFNEYGDFPGTGAYQSQSSKYYSWYTFQQWPNKYSTYFGVTTLPELSESSSVKKFIFASKKSVAQYWLSQGADGWRLDHAVGKSPSYWQAFRKDVKKHFPKDVLICECDNSGSRGGADNLLGNEFDGDMNYPFRSGVLSFYAAGTQGYFNIPFKAGQFLNYMLHIVEITPKPAIYASMNVIGTHDTDRALDVVKKSIPEMKQLAAFQMSWIGMPEIYYGDEAGLGGSGEDPLKRKFFPWSSPNTDLQAFYRKVIKLRNAHQALRDGSVSPLASDDTNRTLAFLRKDKKESVAVVINDNRTTAQDVVIPTTAFKSGTKVVDGIAGTSYTVSGPTMTVHLPADTTAILVPKAKK